MINSATAEFGIQMIEEQRNNPLHGLKLETMVTALVDCYGWKILYAALKLSCFKTNPTIEASIVFLKKTEWAREKVENFYLYRYKRMPKAVGEQFYLKPRERGFAAGLPLRQPMPLTLESIAKMQAQASAEYEAYNSRQTQKSTTNRYTRDMRTTHTDRPTYSDKPTNGDRAKPVKTNTSGKTPSTDPNDPWGTKS